MENAHGIWGAQGALPKGERFCSMEALGPFVGHFAPEGRFAHMERSWILSLLSPEILPKVFKN